MILLRSARWAIRLAWATDRRHMIMLLLMASLLGLVPAGLAMVLRELVNEVTAVAKAGGGMTTAIIFWLAITFAVTLVDVVGGFTSNYLSQRLGDELNLRITAEILQHASDLDVPHFEDPQFQDILERMQQNIAGRFSMFVSKMLTVLNNIVQMATLSAVLIAI